jgi:dipeptidyl aminopeptidase/acylaminoacyl peptidase
MRHHVFIAVALLTASTAAAQKRAITFDDFAAVRAVADPQPSPDGKVILYAMRVADVAANKRTAQTFVVPSAGGTPRAFPSPSVSASEARWSPDGTHIAYIASDQLWTADANGANAKQLTHLNGGATGPVWSSAGDRLASHRPCIRIAPPMRNVAKAKAASDNKASSCCRRVDVSALECWDEGTRSHLFHRRAAAAHRAIWCLAKRRAAGPFLEVKGYA